MRNPFDKSRLAGDADWVTPGHSIWRFRSHLGFGGDVPPVTLGEGGTPLIRSRLDSGYALWWKDEGRNPTGSHKDRALSFAATEALASQSKVIAVVSAGSTGLSGAAYSARAGLKSLTLVGKGSLSARTYPAFALGSTIVEVDAGIDDIIVALRRASGRNGIYDATTALQSNSTQALGSRTIAYEIAEEMPKMPDWVIVPTGGGGTIHAIYRGFEDLLERGEIARIPRLAAVVPAAYNALETAFRRAIVDADAFAALPDPEDVPTVLNKLAHSHPPDGLSALQAIRDSGGTVVSVNDDAALDAVAAIGALDGLFVEPSTAVILPALQALAATGEIAEGDSVVAIACGSGFRESFLVEGRRPQACACVSLSGLAEMLTSF